MDGYPGSSSYFYLFVCLFVCFCKERFCCEILSLFSMQDLEDFSNFLKSSAVGMCLNSTFDTAKPHCSSEKGETQDMKGARMCSLACDNLSKAFILDKNLGSRTKIRKYQALTV